MAAGVKNWVDVAGCYIPTEKDGRVIGISGKAGSEKISPPASKVGPLAYV